MRILPLILLAASLLLSGCVIVPFPHTVVDAPRASGRVLDASSHHPISNATVGYTGYPATTVLTDSLGQFTTGISRTWRLAGMALS
jgi:hypothetical protein